MPIETGLLYLQSLSYSKFVQRLKLNYYHSMTDKLSHQLTREKVVTKERFTFNCRNARRQSQ